MIIVDELEAYISRDTKSLRLMDQFEGFEGDITYKRIVVKNILIANHAFCHLVIERANQREYVGDITFTNFKQGYTGKLRDYIDSELTPEIIKKYSGKKEIFYFSKPYRLRAQNSGNREGYGTEWDWSYGVGTIMHEGTLYGETTDYVIAGVYIE